MKIGFTGSRKGMTPLQRVLFELLISNIPVLEFHHGDCLGSDAEAHAIVRRFHKECKIIIHPPIDEKDRAHCPADEYRPPFGYLERNRHIVGGVNLMIATPPTIREQMRGGTWYTIKYSRGVNREVIVLPPIENVRDELM